MGNYHAVPRTTGRPTIQTPLDNNVRIDIHKLAQSEASGQEFSKPNLTAPTKAYFDSFTQPTKIAQITRPNKDRAYHGPSVVGLQELKQSLRETHEGRSVSLIRTNGRRSLKFVDVGSFTDSEEDDDTNPEDLDSNEEDIDLEEEMDVSDSDMDDEGREDE